MTSINQATTLTTSKAHLTLTDVFPESTYDWMPVREQNDALETYRAYDDGGLETVPAALEAYVDAQQRMWL